MTSLESVFLLWHSYEVDGCEEAKLIGVYANAADAARAQRRLEHQTGFAERPEGFEVVEYSIGMDHWTEGYVRA